MVQQPELPPGASGGAHLADVPAVAVVLGNALVPIAIRDEDVTVRAYGDVGWSVEVPRAPARFFKVPERHQELAVETVLLDRVGTSVGDPYDIFVGVVLHVVAEHGHARPPGSEVPAALALPHPDRAAVSIEAVDDTVRVCHARHAAKARVVRGCIGPIGHEPIGSRSRQCLGPGRAHHVVSDEPEHHPDDDRRQRQ